VNTSISEPPSSTFDDDTLRWARKNTKVPTLDQLNDQRDVERWAEAVTEYFRLLKIGDTAYQVLLAKAALSSRVLLRINHHPLATCPDMDTLLQWLRGGVSKVLHPDDIRDQILGFPVWRGQEPINQWMGRLRQLVYATDDLCEAERCY
jgi:hypothetical protein